MQGLRFGEVVIAGDATNGVVLDIYDQECTARLDGEVIRSHALATVCARALAMQGVHLVWSFISDKPANVAAATQQASTPAPVALPAPLPAEPVTVTERIAAGRTRCPWYGSIRRFYAVIGERGLPTDDEAVRALLGRLLGRDVPTRKALTAADWEAAASAAKWLAA